MIPRSLVILCTCMYGDRVMKNLGITTVGIGLLQKMIGNLLLFTILFVKDAVVKEFSK